MSHHPACRIRETGLITIACGTDTDTAIETAETLTRGGVSTVEITANTDGVLGTLRDVSASFTADKVTIGAGTALDNETARAALLVGMEYLATPTFDEGVIRAGNRYGAPSMVGIATPTEAVNTYEAGAGMVKVFPAGMLGPEFVSALGGPPGHIPTVSTGGVALDIVNEFFDAGATVVGVGGTIVDNDAVSRGDFAIIETNTCSFVEAVKRARRD